MLKNQYQNNYPEAGCDEAGRGCLAGPVFAAAVILPMDYTHAHLNDSKQLNAKQREKFRKEIIKEAIAWSVQKAEAAEIDRLNIANASFLAVHRALDALTLLPQYIIMDGNRFNPYKNIPHKCIVKGDALFLSIAAASILAKTFRDDFMVSAHQDFPQYHWNKNKGYPTLKHREAIAKFGLSPFHRKTFRLSNRQLKIEFP